MIYSRSHEKSVKEHITENRGPCYRPILPLDLAIKSHFYQVLHKTNVRKRVMFLEMLVFIASQTTLLHSL